jgi:hypothetical protein
VEQAEVPPSGDKDANNAHGTRLALAAVCNDLIWQAFMDWILNHPIQKLKTFLRYQFDTGAYSTI